MNTQFSRRQYSIAEGRSLSAMVAQGALNRAGTRRLVRPFVVLAARCLGPGPLRLQMVKLAHVMGERPNYFEVFYGRQRRAIMPAAVEDSAAQRAPRAS